MLLRRHNLNLLPILRELLRTRSVTRTAAAVGLGQSAVSSALARLRDEFRDELLVSVGRRMELTQRASELIEPVERACQEAELVFRAPVFDPEKETRTFVIAAADYVAYLLAPPLTRILSAEAPGATVQFVDYPADLEAALLAGTIDCTILPDDTAGGMTRRLQHRLLFEDELVVIASARQPPFEGPLTLEQFAGLPHAMFKLAPRDSISHEALLLAGAGIRPHVRTLVEQFLMLPAVIEGSSLIALLQRRLALAMARGHDITIHPMPLPQPRLALSLYWSGPRDNDPAHRWFRRALARVSEGLDG